jgi:hypothetical protein
MKTESKKPQLDIAIVNRIKRILIEAGAPMVPLSLLFEQLGYTGITGIYWGVLMGVISGLAIEMGYEITKFGSQIVLTKKDTTQQKAGSDKEKK